MNHDTQLGIDMENEFTFFKIIKTIHVSIYWYWIPQFLVYLRDCTKMIRGVMYFFYLMKGRWIILGEQGGV